MMRCEGGGIDWINSSDRLVLNLRAPIDAHMLAIRALNHKSLNHRRFMSKKKALALERNLLCAVKGQAPTSRRQRLVP